MTTIDRDLIRRKLEELRDYVQTLSEFRNMEQQKYLGDYHHYALAEHFLRLAIETVLDISRSLVIALELKTPEDAHGLLPLLASQGILPVARKSLPPAAIRARRLAATVIGSITRTFR